jgi:hypothetical protein
MHTSCYIMLHHVKVTVCDIADDCGFAAVCEIPTGGFEPKFICLLTT